MTKINNHSPRIKIVFVLPTLHPGGAERVISFIAQNIDIKKFTVKLLIIGFESESAFKIDNVNVKFLNKKRVLKSIPAIINFILKEKPNIVLSSISHLNTVMAYVSILFPSIKFIARQASIISISDGNKKKIKSLIYKQSFNLFDAIVCQSKDMLLDLKEIYNVNNNKLHIINNPITSNVAFGNTITKKQSTIKFITIGRLVKIKGHERILNILKNLNYSFEYQIIGDGPEKNRLKELVEVYKLNNKVFFLDYTDDVFSYLISNDLFLQGSFAEGFPNAVLESCLVGTPVIAFDVPGGTKEIISSGVNGYLAKTEEDYLNYLNNLKKFDKNEVRNVVLSKFNKEKILQQYEDLFLKLLS